MSLNFSYLALGDSYTIGEGVPLYESYPYQAIQMLRSWGISLHAPEIVARSGWTTSELASHLEHTILNTSYDIASLLIGVNNQYRGLSANIYDYEFEQLLSRCLSLTEGSERVVVLSVPNWGLTPFANGLDKVRISREIAGFNELNRGISEKYKVIYIDITSGSPETTDDLTFLTGDGLHPSGKAYRRWASMLAEDVKKVIKKDL
jgi:lysophospholipase L1-like esterase